MPLFSFRDGLLPQNASDRFHGRGARVAGPSAGRSAELVGRATRQIHQGDPRAQNRDDPLRPDEEEIPRLQRHTAPGADTNVYFIILIKIYTWFIQIPTAIGEWPDHRVHRGQILLRQIPHPAQVPALAVPPSRPRAEAHLFAPGSVQNRVRPAVHKEVDRHSDIHDD